MRGFDFTRSNPSRANISHNQRIGLGASVSSQIRVLEVPLYRGSGFSAATRRSALLLSSLLTQEPGQCLVEAVGVGLREVMAALVE